MSAPLLMIARCDNCARAAWPPRLLCPDCGAATFSAVDAGPGTVTERTETTSPAGAPVAIASVSLDATPVVVIARAERATAGSRVTLTVDPSGAVTAEPSA